MCAVLMGGSDVTAPGDITSPDDLDALYEVIAARGKGLDILAANTNGGANQI